MKQQDFAASIGPQSKAEERVFVAETLRVDVLYALRVRMRSQGVDECELANRLGVREVDVQDIFKDGYKLTLCELSYVFHALGDELYVGVKLKGGIVPDSPEEKQ